MIDPVGTAPAWWCPGKPAIVVLPWAAARAPADVAHGSGPASRCGRRSPGTPSTARRWCACSACRSRALRTRSATPRRASPAITSWRSRPACGAAKSRWSRASSRALRPCTRELRAAAARAPRARDLLRGRVEHRRPGGAAARGAAHGDGGVVHGRAAGGASHRAARIVRVRHGRRRGLLQRGEDGAAGGGARADRCPRSRVRAGGRRDGRRRAAALRRGHRGGDHGDGGTGRRNGTRSRWGRSAGAYRTAEGRRNTRTLRLPGDRVGHQRPLDDGGDAPPAARALRERRLPRPPPPALKNNRERAPGPDVPRARPPPRTRARGSSAGATRSSSSRRDVRPVRPEALHVTLVFLGWQDESAAGADRRGWPLAPRPQSRRPGPREGVKPAAPEMRACSRSTWRTTDGRATSVAGRRVGRARGGRLVHAREAAVLAHIRWRA